MSQIAKEGATRKSILYVLLAALIAVALACVAGSAVRAFAVGDDEGDAPEAQAQEIKTQTTDDQNQADDKAKDGDNATKKGTEGKGKAEPAADTQEMTVQANPTVSADPSEWTFVVAGDAKEFQLTIDGVVRGDLTVEVLKTAEGAEKSDIVKLENTPIDESDKLKVTPATDSAKVGSAVIVIKEKTGDVKLCTIPVMVKMRTVAVTVEGSASETATVTMKVNGAEKKPTQSGATYSVEVTAQQSVDYSVVAKGYDPEEGKKGTIDKGAEDVNESVALTPHTYSISYDGIDATATNPTSNPTSYTVDDIVTLTDPTSYMNVFLGWTGSNGNTPQKNLIIDKGTKTENLKFTANWEKPTKSGMKAKVTGEAVTYDAKEHSLKITSSNVKSTTVRYSNDKGKTYTLTEAPTFTDAGAHKVYYQLIDKDKVYKPVEDVATITITASNTITDSATGVIAKSDFFTKKENTTNTNIVQMQVSNLTDSSDDASHVAELKKKYFNANTMSAFKVYDVSMFLLNRSKDTDKEITSDFGNLALSFPVDSSLNGKAAVVYELHDNGDKVTEIPFKNLKVADGKVSISGVTKLSEFVVVVSKTTSSPTNNTSKTTSKGSTTAKTGDTIEPIIPISIAIIAVAAIAFAAYRVRKLRQ